MDRLKRFTNKYPDSTPVYHKYYLNGYHYEQGEHIDKLGQIEDIEEQLNLNLDVFVCAMLNGIYYKSSPNTITKITNVRPMTVQLLGILGFVDFDDPKISDKTRHYCFFKEPDYWLFEDYGITWALTKKELENEEHA